MVEMVLTFYTDCAKLPSLFTFSVVLGNIITPKPKIWLVSPSLKLTENKLA